MTSMLVLEICTAYEQGFGHGYDKRDLSNPYSNGYGKEAWDYGYSEGLRKRSSDDAIRSEVRAIEHARRKMESKIYAAQHVNYDEGQVIIISLHRTRKGAEKASADHRAARIRGIERVLGLGEMDSDRVAYCLKDEDWRVEEIEVRE